MSDIIRDDTKSGLDHGLTRHLHADPVGEKKDPAWCPLCHADEGDKACASCVRELAPSTAPVPHESGGHSSAPRLTDPQPTPREILAKLEALIAAERVEAVPASAALDLMRALVELADERDRLEASLTKATTTEEEALEFIVEIAFAIGAVHHQKEAPSYAKDNEEILAAAKNLRAELERVTKDNEALRAVATHDIQRDDEADEIIASLTARSEQAERERDAELARVGELDHALRLAGQTLDRMGIPVSGGSELHHLGTYSLGVADRIEEVERRLTERTSERDALRGAVEKERAAHALEKEAHEHTWNRKRLHIQERNAARAEASRLRGAVEQAARTLESIATVPVAKCDDAQGWMAWARSRAAFIAKEITAALSPAPGAKEEA